MRRAISRACSIRIGRDGTRPHRRGAEAARGVGEGDELTECHLEAEIAAIHAARGEETRSANIVSSGGSDVLTVGAVAPFSIGRPTSIAAIEAARNGEKTLAVFAQRDQANEDPSEADVHPIGCAARLLSVIRTEDGAAWIVVWAVRWVRLEAIERRRPYLVARVSPFTIEEEETDEAKRLHQALRERVRTFAAKLPDPEQLVRMIDQMTALQLADATLANLSCTVDDKARYASETSLVARLRNVLDLVDRAA